MSFFDEIKVFLTYTCGKNTLDPNLQAARAKKDGKGMEPEKSNWKTSQGFTLIEILVSITILSIIIIAFLTFFMQSANTNAQSEETLDATYVAQSQLEEVYNISLNHERKDAGEELEKLGYTAGSSETEGSFFTVVKDSFHISIQLRKTEKDSHLTNVLVVVKNPSGKLKAQMETVINWQTKKEAESLE